MDEYERHGESLVAQIARLRGLRDAQVPGSARWCAMQDRIDALTDELLAFDGRVPALRDIDRQIAEFEKHLAPVVAEVQWRDDWRMRTKWLGATAGVLALAVLGAVAGWSWMAVLVSFAVAAVCGVRSWAAGNLRRQAVDEQATLDRILVALRERQAALRGGGDPGQPVESGQQIR